MMTQNDLSPALASPARLLRAVVLCGILLLALGQMACKGGQSAANSPDDGTLNAPPQTKTADNKNTPPAQITEDPQLDLLLGSWKLQKTTYTKHAHFPADAHYESQDQNLEILDILKGKLSYTFQKNGRLTHNGSTINPNGDIKSVILPMYDGLSYDVALGGAGQGPLNIYRDKQNPDFDKEDPNSPATIPSLQRELFIQKLSATELEVSYNSPYGMYLFVFGK